MPLSAAQVKVLIDDQIINKTLPYSISNVEHGNILKDIIDLITNGKKEIIPFENQSVLTVELTTDRKNNFGGALLIAVEQLGADGKYRQIYAEVSPDSITNTTVYTVDLGGSNTGRLIIF